MLIDVSKPQGPTGRAITYRLLTAVVHPLTRKCKGYGTIPADVKFIVGRPHACEMFSHLPNAIRHHAIVTGCADDFVQVVEDHTAPMKSGRLVQIGEVSTRSEIGRRDRR